jgi:hypothetical protein
LILTKALYINSSSSLSIITFARDEYGVLGVYYNGTSPLFQFDDYEIIDELGEWSIAPHVPEFVYDHIEENGIIADVFGLFLALRLFFTKSNHKIIRPI